MEPMTPATGVVTDTRFLAHETDNGHPENPRRLKELYHLLETPEMKGLFTRVVPRPAVREELLLVHAREHVDLIAATRGRESTSLTPDTFTSPGSYEAALLAAGGLCKAVSLVVSGELANAFGLVRPPGHHAERSRAMGYCLFNNVAVAAMFARRFLGLHRVLIVDWDVHHGNGTQHCFERDPSVLFFSTHQYPYFPRTGDVREVGIGPGEGFTINVPLGKGLGDPEFAAIFEEILRPVALEFQPELILVSAGFDTHGKDPLGAQRMTPAGFAALTRSLMDVADLTCQGRLVMTLEGGYHLEALVESVKAVLKEMAGLSVSAPRELAAQAQTRKIAKTLKRARHVHKTYWKAL